MYLNLLTSYTVTYFLKVGKLKLIFLYFWLANSEVCQNAAKRSDLWYWEAIRNMNVRLKIELINNC